MINFDEIRFKHDMALSSGADTEHISQYMEEVRRENLSTSIRVQQEIFPSLANAISHVRDKILPDYKIEAYVRNNPEMQALCFVGEGKNITISLTSGLIQIYTEQELRFVIGHEIGHHIYQHHRLPQIHKGLSRVEELNILAKKRAAEITADRIGFLAAEIDDALMAMIKLASGLPSSYIRKDFSSYLRQARELHDDVGHLHTLLSSHPSCTTRMRALMWFSISQPFNDATGRGEKAPLDKEQLDMKVAKDLSAIGGYKLSEANQLECSEAIKWGIFHIFSSDGKLSKTEQSLLDDFLPKEELLEAYDILKKNGPNEIESKFHASIIKLRHADIEIKRQLLNELEKIVMLSDGDKEIARAIVDASRNELGSA